MKKLLALLLTLCMLTALASCGGDAKTEEKKSETKVEEKVETPEVVIDEPDEKNELYDGELFPADIDGKKGYVTEDSEWIIEPQFEAFDNIGGYPSEFCFSNGSDSFSVYPETGKIEKN